MSAPTRLIAGPFNRVEGDLEIRLDIVDGHVTAAYANSPLFRGFERMLEGKDPRDALTIVPRICGICSVSQSMAAARALAGASGVAMPPNGLYAQALIHAAENIADHLTHFYLFFMPDFAREVYSGAPWFEAVAERFRATQGAGAREAVAARAKLLHVMGLLAGKWPHTLAVQPGGTTRVVEARDRVKLLSIIGEFRAWTERSLFGGPLEGFADLDSRDALAEWRDAGGGDAGSFLRASDDLDLGGAGFGPPRFMSFGGYRMPEGVVFASGLRREGRAAPLDLKQVTEDTAESWMLGDTPLHPFEGATFPDPEMADGYSWCKAPRLAGETVEVGALARQVVDDHPLARSLVGGGPANVHARVVGRLLEIARLVPLMETWARVIDPLAPFIEHGSLPDEEQALGMTEAARGSLGHWLRISEGRIANYQIVAPTTWNFSPRDRDGIPGPVEQALVGAPVRTGETTPLSAQHIVRSFDPCMVCTVH